MKWAAGHVPEGCVSLGEGEMASMYRSFMKYIVFKSIYWI